jgi:hypothetical protein
MTLPTLTAQTHAWLRHVYTGLGIAGSLITTLALLPPDQLQALIAAVHQIGDGFEGVLAGVGVLVGIGSALYARFTAKPESQVAAVEAQGNVVVPVSDRSAAAPPGFPQ